MEAQLLRSSNALFVTDCHIPGIMFSKTRVHSEKEKRLQVAICMSRKGPKTIRFLSEAARARSSKSKTDLSANGSNTTGLVAGDESLHQQQPFISGTESLPPTVGDFKYLSFSEHHIVFLGFIATAMTCALFGVLVAAIPTLIALRKAAESLRKLADAAREELPETMAAVRVSGMEIRDLTMELSDIGQEISAGVRTTSRAVRAAEDVLRRVGSHSMAVLQERAVGKVEAVKPAVARAARSTREALVRARSLVHSLMTLNRLSSWLRHYWKLVRPQQKKSIYPPSQLKT